MGSRKFLIFVAFFCLGALAGTLGDFAHVSFGVERYPLGGGARLPLLGLPIWVPILFGLATFLIAGAHALARRTVAPTPPPSMRRAVAAFFAFLALYGASAVLPLTPTGLKFCVLLIGALAMRQAFDRSALGDGLAVLTALGGVTVECLLSGHGVFYYRPEEAGLAGVPFWLPWLYFGASYATGIWVQFVKQAKTAPIAQSVTAE